MKYSIGCASQLMSFCQIVFLIVVVIGLWMAVK